MHHIISREAGRTYQGNFSGGAIGGKAHFHKGRVHRKALKKRA